MKLTFIYALVDPRTDAIRYVGKANDPEGRLKGGHLQGRKESNTRKRRWVEELSLSGLIPALKIIEECLMRDWREREIFWIAEMRSRGVDLVNTADGGAGIDCHSERTKKAKSRAMKGRKMPPGFGAKVSARCKGKKMSAEARRNMCLAKTGEPLSAAHLGKLSAALSGRPISMKHRRALSIAKTGKLMTGKVARGVPRPWVRAKVSAGKLGKLSSDETKLALSAAQSAYRVRRRALIAAGSSAVDASEFAKVKYMASRELVGSSPPPVRVGEHLSEPAL